MTRPSGTPNLSMEQIKKIIRMSKSMDPVYSRREIAMEVGCGMSTIWTYQKKYLKH